MAKEYSVSLVIKAATSKAVRAVKTVRSVLKGLTSQSATVALKATPATVISAVRSATTAVTKFAGRTATATLKVTYAGVKSGVRAATRLLTSWKTAAAGLLGVGGLGLLSKQMGSVTAQTRRWASQLGASFDEYNRLRNFALPKIGLEPEDFDASVLELQKRIGEAVQEGSGAGYNGFLNLGLDASELDLMTLDQQLNAITEALFEMSQARKSFNLDEILGGEGEKLYPLFDAIFKAKGGLQELTAEAEKYGFVVSSYDAEQVKQQGQAWQKLIGTIRGLGQQVATQLAPFFATLSDGFANALAVGDIRPKINAWLAKAFKAIADGMRAFDGVFGSNGSKGLLEDYLLGPNGSLLNKLTKVITKVADLLGLIDAPITDQDISSKRNELEAVRSARQGIESDAVGYRSEADRLRAEIESGALSIAGKLAAELKLKFSESNYEMSSGAAGAAKIREASLEQELAELERKKTAQDRIAEIEESQANTLEAVDENIKSALSTMADVAEAWSDDFLFKSENQSALDAYSAQEPERVKGPEFTFGTVQQEIDALAQRVSMIDASVESEVAYAQKEINKLSAKAKEIAVKTGDREQVVDLAKLNFQLDKAVEAEKEGTKEKKKQKKELEKINAELKVLRTQLNMMSEMTNLTVSFYAKYGLTASDPLRRYFSGGEVRGPGSGDVIPALVRNGEHILTPGNVQTIGRKNLEVIKRHGVNALRPVVNVSSGSQPVDLKAVFYTNPDDAIQDWSNSPGSTLVQANNPRGYE